MKKSNFARPEFIVLILLAAALLVFAWPGRTSASSSPARAGALTAVGTAFTYQGQLEDDGSPASGSYDFQFLLFDDALAGVQVGPTVTLDDLDVEDGFFSAELDFGKNAFADGERWLQIEVRPGSSGGAYTSLTPRQKITPAPAALNLPNVYIDESLPFMGIGRDFRISGNEVFGIRSDSGANVYGGMYVETSNAAGWPFYGYATNESFRAWTYYNGTTGDWNLYNGGIRLTVPNTGGLQIPDSGTDGLRILDAADDGIQIGSANHPNYGVYIPSPGVTAFGLWPNTANAANEWALYTVDKISAANVVVASYSLVSQVAGTDSLSAGDLVAVAGVADPIPGSGSPTPLVRLADAESYSGVIGVVESRMLLQKAPGKDDVAELVLLSAEGAAQPGEYVSLVVFGVAEVKVDSTAAINPGERLTASSLAGAVRPLASREIDGMLVTEGAPVVGIALSGPVEGKDTIPVFVTLR